MRIFVDTLAKVNDMAELNIDSALVRNASILQKEEKMVEMQNGCICCNLREDLLVEVYNLAKQGTFDYLVIESTGISEPLQVIHCISFISFFLFWKKLYLWSLFEVAETFTFTLDELEEQHGHDHDHGSDDDHDHDHEPEVNPFADIPILKDHARLDNCITVIDAVNFDATFNCGEFLSDRFKDASESDDRTVVHLMIDQIEFANVIVLNKIDMVTKPDLERIRKTLQKLNPVAEVYATNYSKVPLSKVLNTHKFDFKEAAKSSGWLKELRGAEMVPESEEYGISSFIYHRQKPFVPRKIYDLMMKNFLLQEKTDDEQKESDDSALLTPPQQAVPS